MKDKFTSGLMEEVVVLMESESVKNRITEIKHKSESIYLELIKDREVKLARGFERLLQDAKNRFPKKAEHRIEVPELYGWNFFSCSYGGYEAYVTLTKKKTIALIKH